MKRIYTLLTMLLMVCAGAWAETVTWESKAGWTQASGGQGGVTWFGVHTPGDATTTYSLTAIQIMQQSGGNNNNDNYLAIARVSASSSSSLNAAHVVAISDNHLAASQNSASLQTYNFSSGVQLLGGTTYYFVFLSSNTPTDGNYTVRESRLSVNHQSYGAYTYGCSSANWWPYFTATLDSSPTTGFLTGDMLGGTTGSGWQTVWTSGTSPSFTLTSSAAYINGGSASGGLDIRSGSSKTATYTITAPTGYIITDYKLFGKALNGNQTVTPAEGGSAVVFTSAGNSISVSGIRKASASFTLSGENQGLFLHAMQVTLVPYSELTVTTLPTTNDQVYVIANARGTFNFADGATAMSVVRPVNTNLDAAAQQIGLVYHNDNYYLYSVNTGKYLTADNTLTAIPTNNEQVSITASGNASYPWFIKFKNIANKNINVNTDPRVFIDNWSTIDAGNSNVIMPAGAYDLSAALDKFNTRSVTYNLSYGGNSTFRTVSDVITSLSSPASDFVPSSFLNDCVSLSYSPETISSETTEVTVTATWNSPFEISPALSAGNFASGTKWYVVDIHSNAGDYTWQYDASSQEIQTPVIAKDAYASLTDANLWCFIGNPFDGFKIYNKAAGPTKTIRKAESGNKVSYMSTTDDRNNFKVYASTSGISSSYCFKLDGDTYYLNQQKNNEVNKLCGWDARDAGSSCRFLPPGKYHLAAMNSWNLDAPLGAVGTKAYILNESLRESMIVARDNIKEDPFSVVDRFFQMNILLNPVRDSEFITLTDGYYRVLSAMKGFNNTAAWYYNPATSTDHITWAKAATTAEQQANSIFKFTANEDKWNIYSPNAQKYMIYDNTAFQAQTGTIGDEAGDVTITSIGSAQYTLKMNVQTIHCNGHNNGNNSIGTLINYNSNGLGEASTWYIVKVDNIEVALNGPIDGYYYATLYLPFDVTISGANAYVMAQSGEWLVPTQLTDNKVPDGTAVLLKGTSATATATINTDAAFSTDNENALQGTYVPKDFALNGGATDEYFLGVYNGNIGFYRSEVVSKSGYYTLGANKAYLPSASAEARGFAINWDDETTGIRSIDNGKQSVKNGAIYDLSGRRVENPQRGMYIVNGRVVVVK